LPIEPVVINTAAKVKTLSENFALFSNIWYYFMFFSD